MQEECLGGSCLAPTPELPGDELRLLACWALGSTEGDGLGPEYPWGWGALSEGPCVGVPVTDGLSSSRHGDRLRGGR